MGLERKEGHAPSEKGHAISLVSHNTEGVEVAGVGLSLRSSFMTPLFKRPLVIGGVIGFKIKRSGGLLFGFC